MVEVEHKDLKSSMERFIVCTVSNKSTSTSDLKSSMERFIVCRKRLLIYLTDYLKSSMERFIAFINCNS